MERPVLGGKAKIAATLEIDEKVNEFAQINPVVYFPKLVTIDEYINEELQSRKTVQFSSVMINSAIPLLKYRPIYREGTEVTDFVKNTKYKVDASGNALGVETPLKKIAVGPHSTDQFGGYRLPSEFEETRFGGWLVPAGLSMILVGMTVILWRRRRV